MKIIGLLIIGLNSCKEYKYEDGITTFGEVYFLRKNIATDLIAKVNNSPIDWQNETGKIKVPEVETTISFFDKKTGNKIGEKTINIIIGKPAKFDLFQPTVNDPLAFLDSEGQLNEEAPPVGFIKLKIANYAGNLLPKNLDIIVLGLNGNMETVELATLNSVSDNLETANFQIIPNGGADILAYTFKFKNNDSNTFIKNLGGKDYWNQNVFLYPGSMNPIPEKGIYTVYLRSIEQNNEFESFIKANGKFYEINPEILFAN